MKTTILKTPVLPANSMHPLRTRWCVLAAAHTLAACGGGSGLGSGCKSLRVERGNVPRFYGIKYAISARQSCASSY